MRTALGVLVLVLLLASSRTYAQRFEIAPFIGFRLGGSVSDLSGATYPIDGSASAGLIASIPLGGPNYVELLYSHQASSFGVINRDFTGTDTYPISVDHWMAGAARELESDSGKVRPFLGVSFGVTHIGSRAATVGSVNCFAMSLGGGVKFDLSRTLAVRLDARGYLVFTNAALGAFCGGAGCTANVAASGLLQVEGTASLVIKL